MSTGMASTDETKGDNMSTVIHGEVLKSCPFCGRDRLEVVGVYGGAKAIVCADCSIHGPFGFVQPTDQRQGEAHELNVKKAIELWNERR